MVRSSFALYFLCLCFTTETAFAEESVAIPECVDGPVSFQPDLGSLGPRVEPQEIQSRTADKGIEALSWDGRIALLGNGGWYLQVFRPENVVMKNGRPDFLSQQAFSPMFTLEVDNSSNTINPDTQRGLHHIPSMVPVPGLPQNPFRSNADGTPNTAGSFETYEIYLFVSQHKPDFKMGRQKLRVVVKNPRSKEAAVSSALLNEKLELLTTASGSNFPGIEPAVTVDGHLMIYQRRFDPPLPYPSASPLPGYGSRLYFSYNQKASELSGWSEPLPLSDLYAHRDDLVNGVSMKKRYALARSPLRRSNGIAYVTGEEFVGAYPWIDQDGSLLLFTSTLTNPPAATQASLSMAGQLTRNIIRHIDGPINPNRSKVSRTVTTSPGIMGSAWSPFAGESGVKFPFFKQRKSLPAFSFLFNKYNEVLFTEQEGYVAYFDMNEMDPRVKVAPTENPLTRTVLDTKRTPDSSGNFNSGFLFGGAAFPIEAGKGDINPGINGRAIYFNNGSYVRVNASPSLDSVSKALTVEVWIKPLQEDATDRSLVFRTGSFNLAKNGNGVWAALTINGVTKRTRVYGPKISVGAWTHLALAYDSQSGMASLYRDGVLLGTEAFPRGNISITSGSPLYIGPGNGANQSGYLFLLDQVGISARARSASEIELSAYLLRSQSVAATELPLGLDPMELALSQMPTPPQISLGKQLFFDKRLSGDGKVSCASCHQPESGYSDGFRISRGMIDSNGMARVLSRRSPSVINRAFGRSHFWDGRAKSLEEQAIGPITNPLEMNNRLCRVVSWLNQTPEYRKAFEDAFAGPPSAVTLARAIAAFQKNLLSGNSRYDRYNNGDLSQLSASEVNGKNLFFGKARCVGCHSGSNLSDELFHNTGTTSDIDDFGKFGITGNDADLGMFKTPSLREVSQRKHFFHDGSASSLVEVINFYNDGGRSNSDGLKREIVPLGLTAGEKEELALFLKVLTSPSLDVSSPSLPVATNPIYPKGVVRPIFSGTVEQVAVEDGFWLLLERSPTPETRGNFAKAIAGGLSKENFLLMLFDSAEFMEKHTLGMRGSEAYVTLLFQILLQRLPDENGLLYWKNTIERGQLTRREAFREFIKTAEFKIKHPTL